jgi:hypothetical protein
VHQNLWLIPLVAATAFGLGRYCAPPAELSAPLSTPVQQTPERTFAESQHSFAEESGASATAAISIQTTDWQSLLLAPAGAKRLLGFAEKLKLCSLAELTSLAAWLDQHPGLLQEEKELLYETWAQQDPRTALLALQRSADYQPAFLAAVLQAWAQKEPGAAAAHFGRLSASQQRHCLPSWIAGWAAVDPSAAYQHVHSLPDETQRDQAMQGILSAQLLKAPSQAIAWVQSLPKVEQESLNHSLASQLVLSDPISAEGYLDAQPQLALGIQGMRSLALHHYKTTGKPPIDWALKQKHPRNQADALGVAMGLWTKSDPTAAATWLNQQDPGPQRDAIVTAFAHEVALQAPASAMEWAETMEQPEDRQATIEQILARWHQLDPLAAKTWAEANRQADAYQGVADR